MAIWRHRSGVGAVPLEALAGIAGIAGLSQSQFGRAFKAPTGVSPHRWQLQVRIAEAKRLLLSRSLPLAPIAIATGFAGQGRLSRVSNRIVGRSPSAWRREQRGA